MSILFKIKAILKKITFYSHDSHKYIDCPRGNLSFSHINLDMRNPLPNAKYITIGKDSSINVNCVFETETGYIQIGDRVFIGGGQIICRSKVIIESNVLIAWNCLLYDHNSHSFDYRERQKDLEIFFENMKNGRNVLKNEGKNWAVVKSAPIRICHDAWIGANVTILGGVTIGEGAIIGAGSVVRHDIPAWAIAYGNPCVVVAENRYKK